MNSEERSNEADLRAMLDRFPPGEWFTASNSADEDNPWWIFAFDKWDDEDDSKTYPIGAVHCERGEFTAESELAEFIAAARNAIPSLIAERDAALARIAAVEADNETLRRLARDYHESVSEFCYAARSELTADGFTVVCSLAAEHDGAHVFVEHDILRLSLAASPTPTGPETGE